MRTGRERRAHIRAGRERLVHTPAGREMQRWGAGRGERLHRRAGSYKDGRAGSARAHGRAGKCQRTSGRARRSIETGEPSGALGGQCTPGWAGGGEGTHGRAGRGKCTHGWAGRGQRAHTLAGQDAQDGPAWRDGPAERGTVGRAGEAIAQVGGPGEAQMGGARRGRAGRKRQRTQRRAGRSKHGRTGDRAGRSTDWGGRAGQEWGAAHTRAGRERPAHMRAGR